MRVAAVLIGLSIGVLAGIGAFALLDDESGPASLPTGEPVTSSFPSVDHDEQAAAGLIEAWERWLTGTFYARGTWTRRLDDGSAPLVGPALTVQDPPRRLVVRLGSLVERTNGTVRTCDAELGEVITPACTIGSTGLDYAEAVVADLGRVRVFVTGASRAYDVGFGDPGCFLAETTTFDPAASWGLAAEFCFDHDTGAMVKARVRRASAVDTEVMAEVRAPVSEADFDLG